MRERLLQLRPHGGAEPGQARPRLAEKQRCAEFVRELANRVGQRRLGNAAAPGGAGEVQLLAQREKIDDLSDVHAPRPSGPDPSRCPACARLAEARPLSAATVREARAPQMR
jgi:hypothetical protein